MQQLFARLSKQFFLPTMDKSLQPTSFSSAFMEWLMADWVK